MSSNELYGGLNYVDFTLVNGAFSGNVYGDIVGNFLSCSRIVGLSLVEACSSTTTGVNNASNVAVSAVYEASGAGVPPTLTITASNFKTDDDVAKYRVYWVNEFKSGFGVPFTLPSPLPSPVPATITNATNQIVPC